MKDPPLRLGISACLLGQDVRHDGGNKRDAFLVERWGPFVEWVPVCPEVEVGLGTPRETLRLIREGRSVRLVSQSGIDHTAAMRRFAAVRLRDLSDLAVAGFVLKSKSPSCGMEGVKVHGNRGAPARNGRGVFAHALCERYPLLPIEEETRLYDPRLRENFVERVFAYRRLRALFAGRWTAGSLAAFLARHKLLLLAHSPAAYGRLSLLVAGAKRIPRAELRASYEDGFMAALQSLAAPGRHAKVLARAANDLHLEGPGREELRGLIEGYRRGLLPLVVPLARVRLHARRLDVPSLKDQVYLDPHPLELMLRTHA